MTTAVLKTPAWQRRLATLLVPLAAVGALGIVGYFPAGGRVGGGAGGVGAPVSVGEEFHTILRLETGGRAVTLVRARAVGVEGRVEVDAPLLLRVKGPMPLAGFRGPLPPAYDQAVQAGPGTGYGVVALRGARIPGTKTSQDASYALDLRLRPTATGTSRVAGVEVTYQAGLLRTRTAFLSAPVCLHASQGWKTDRPGCEPG